MKLFLFIGHRIFHNFGAKFLALLLSVGPAKAELGVLLSPGHVTNSGYAAIVLEASSTHVAAYGIYPEGPASGAHQTVFSGTVIRPFRSNNLPDHIVINRTLTSTYLERMGGTGTIVSRIASDGFTQVAATLAAMPHADIRVVIEADPRAVRSFAIAVEARAEKRAQQPKENRTFSFDSMHREGIEIFELAVNISEVLANSSRPPRAPVFDSETLKSEADPLAALSGPLKAYLQGPAQGFAQAPDSARFQTGMGWLYQLVLQEHPPARAAGCGFAEGYRVGAGSPTDKATGLYAKFKTLLDAERADYLESLWEQDTPDKIGKRRGRGARILGKVLGKLMTVAIEGYDIAERVTLDAPIYAEFAAMGDIDPAIVEVVRCEGRLIFEGAAMSTNSVRERSLIYGTVDDVLTETGEGRPRFFGAAQSVTRLVGVGMADAAIVYGDSEMTQSLMKLAADWTVDKQCARNPRGAPVVPTPDAAAFLAGINRVLFEEINLPVIHALGRGSAPLFDPLNGPGTPLSKMSGLSGLPDALIFDLRMVLREQRAIERLMVQKVDSELENELSLAQAAIRCLTFQDRMLRLTNDKDAHMRIIAGVDAMLTKLVDNGTIKQADTRFGNYWWRVATGMSYMFVLHGVDDAQKAKLSNFLRAAIVEDQLKISGIMDIAPQLRQRLEKRAKAVSDATKALSNKPNAGAVRERTRAAATFMDPDLQSRGLLDCQVGSGTLIEQSLGGMMATLPDRVSLLKRVGLDPLANAFDLSLGGGIDLSALQRGVRNSDMCSAIKKRRSAFESAMRPASNFLHTGLLDGASPDDTKHLLVFKRAINLRRELGETAPFFVIGNGTPARSPQTAAELAEALNDARLNGELYRAKLALLDAMIKLTTRELEAIAAQSGLSASSAESVRSLWQQAVPEDKDRTRPDDYEAVYGLDAKVARIEAASAKLEEILAPVLGAFGQTAASAMQHPKELFFNKPQSSQSPNTVEDLASVKTGGAGLGSGFLGTALDFHLIKTKAKFSATSPSRDRPIYEAELSYARAPASRVKGTAKSACPVNEEDCSGSVGTAIQQKKRVALGLFLVGIDLNDEGDITFPNTIAARQSARFEFDRLRAGLIELGMPDFIIPQQFKVDLDFSEDIIPKVKTLIISFDARIADIPLGTVELKLVEKEKFSDIDKVLGTAVEKAVEEGMKTGLKESQKFLAFAKLPSGSSFDKAPLRFSFKTPQSGKPFDYTLDMAGRSLTVRPGFALEAFAGTADAVSLNAKGEILIDKGGVHLLSAEFETDGLETKLTQLVSKIVARFGLPPEMGQGLTLLPEFDGDKLFLRMRAGLNIAGCETDFNQRFDLSAVNFEQSAKAFLKSAGEDLVACAAGQAIGNLPVLNDEVTLFGINFNIAPDDQGGLFALEASGVALDGCNLSEDARRIGRVSIDMNKSVPIDFSSFGPPAQAKLGAILACQLEQSFPQLDSYLLVSNLAMGKGTLAADLKVQNLPYFGTLELGRQDFLDPDLGSAFKSALTRAINAKINEATEAKTKNLLAQKQLDLAGIGKLKFIEGSDALQVSLFEDVPRVSLNGTLEILGSLSVAARVDFMLRKGGPDIDLTIDANALDQMQKLLNTYVGGSLPLLADKGIKINNLNIGPLDADRKVWGAVFGAEVTLPFAPNEVKLELDRIEISTKGLELDDEIRAAITVPMYFGPVALNQIIVIYHTGNGGRRMARQAEKAGITLGGDLTFLEPQLARLLKIEALLDLRNIDDLQFLLTGKLIALDTIALLIAEGDINLGEARMSLTVDSTEKIRKVINISGRADLDLPATRLSANAKLGLLGVDLNSARFQFCAQKCGTNKDQDGFTEMETTSRLLIGEFNLYARTDLGLGDPRLKGSVALDLFGWSPGRAGLDADLDRVKARLSLLGLKLGVTTPSVRTMTPSLLLDIISSLFDISIEDLLEIELNDIKISVMSGDGSSDEYSSSSNEDASESAQDASNDAAEESRETGLPTKKEEEQKDGSEDDVQVGSGPWIGGATGAYCHKIIGASAYSMEVDDPTTRFQIWPRFGTGWPGKWFGETDLFAQRDGAFHWRKIQLPVSADQARQTWHNRNNMITGYAADRLCVLPGGPKLKENVFQVGVGRKWLNSGRDGFCDGDELREFRIQPIPDPDQTKGELRNVGLPILCLPSGRPIWADLYFDKEAQQYIAPAKCPNEHALSEEDLSSDTFKAACIGSGFVTFTQGDLRNGNNPNDGFITAHQELAIMFRIVRPGLLGEPRVVDGKTINFDIKRTDEMGATGFYADRTTKLRGTTTQRTYNLEVYGLGPQRDGLLQLPPIYSSWSLYKHLTEYGFEKWLIWDWIETGKRPRPAFTALNTLLGDQGMLLNPRESKGAYRLIEKTSNGAVVETGLDLPKQLPGTASDSGLTKAVKEDLLHILLDDLLRKQLRGKNWELRLGHDGDLGVHLYYLVEKPTDAATPKASKSLIILLDQYSMPTAAERAAGSMPVNPAEESFTGTHSDGVQIERRLYCTRIGVWAGSLGQDFVQNRSSQQVVSSGFWDRALRDPSGFEIKYGLTQNPLLSIRLQDLCS